MDGLGIGNMSTLIHDQDDVALLCVGDAGSSHKFDVDNLVIVNALNIHELPSALKDASIITNDSTIFTMVDQSSLACVCVMVVSTVPDC